MCEKGLLARTGRHRQRYENQFRLVAGCIPYRLKPNVEDHTGDSVNMIEVLMISSPNRHDLVFPKGGWENDETVHQAALREALEEAGVRGIIHETEIGVWDFRSKSRQDSCSLEGTCRGHMFAMEVTEELDSWPEQASHERIWLAVKDARRLCRYEWMREALDEFLRVMSCKATLPIWEKPETTLPIWEKPETPIYCFVKPSENELIDNAIDALCWSVL